MHFLFHFIFFLCFSLSLFANLIGANSITQNQEVSDFHVGVVLDMDSEAGNVGWNCIQIALADFYATHLNYRTRLLLHLRDSQGDNVQASVAVIELLQNVGVEAIMGPQTSRQAEFAVELGDRVHVPIVSFSATSPLSFQTPYFLRAAASDSSQVKAITAIIQFFKWREVVTIYENSDFGKDIIPFIVDALLVEQVEVPYKSVIPLSATDDKIRVELYKLMNMNCRVFIVHISYTLGSRFFLLVKELGMSEGYVWIITDGVMNFLNSENATLMASMQGVLGVKPFVERSPALDMFTDRWNRKFHQDMNIYGLWAYDTIWTLALAAEKIGPPKFRLGNTRTTIDLTNFVATKTSQTGPELLEYITETRFKGLSGDVHFVKGQLQSDTFQILNVIEKQVKEVGFWTPDHGLSKKLKSRSDKMYSNSLSSLRGIIWPGGSSVAPKGWVVPADGKKLRIGVPVRPGFDAFVRVHHDPYTNIRTISGYSIDFFKLVIAALPYPVAYEFEPFVNANGSSAGNYSNLIYQVYLQKYDAVVGDTTITAQRSLYVDFTLPYAEGGVSMMVPVKHEKKGAWVFLKPLTKDLWLISGAFFIMTGAVIWALEHRVNEAFRGPPSQHVPLILWFPLSTLVFAHRERIVSNLTRFVVIIWIFVILILSSSYTASLSSILTAEMLQPAITSIGELVKNGDSVGYQEGSFIPDMLKHMKFHESKLKPFTSQDEIDEALQRGSQNGGIAAFFSVVPYTKLFIAKFCNRYTMVGPISKTEGFGFAFPRGSPLLEDVSRATLEVLESSKMKELDQALFGIQTSCSEPDDKSSSLDFASFRGLFLITGSVSGSALLVFLIVFCFKNRKVWASANSKRAIWMKIKTILKQFDEKDLSSYRFRRKTAVELRDITASPTSSTVSEFRDVEAPPDFTIISDVREMEISPNFTVISDVRDIEAPPSFTNAFTFTDGNHSLSHGMILINIEDIRLDSVVLEVLDELGLSD